MYQYLAALIAIPFGITSAFTMLNLTGGGILRETNVIYNSNSEENTPTSNINVESGLLPHEDSSSNSIYNRLGKVVNFAKKSVGTVIQNFIKQITGKNELK